MLPSHIRFIRRFARILVRGLMPRLAGRCGDDARTYRGIIERILFEPVINRRRSSIAFPSAPSTWILIAPVDRSEKVLPKNGATQMDAESRRKPPPARRRIGVRSAKSQVQVALLNRSNMLEPLLDSAKKADTARTRPTRRLPREMRIHLKIRTCAIGHERVGEIRSDHRENDGAIASDTESIARTLQA